ncbi:hypothetical protein JXA32_07405 [Candidatus Sumerlaeota bacterium]|nr:hypothetical protein [Candidatus Sumerlaeota bacterium]
MSTAQLDQPVEEARPDVLVSSPCAEGIRVYSPSAPDVSYIVSGTRQHPRCTCGPFQAMKSQLGFACYHIRSVRSQLPDEEQEPALDTSFPPNGNESYPAPASSQSMMTLKRSVSPDGRIDSLSVELSLPLDGQMDGWMIDEASVLLGLQEQIAQEFKGRQQNGNSNDSRNDGNGNGNNGHAHYNRNRNGNGRNYPQNHGNDYNGQQQQRSNNGHGNDNQNGQAVDAYLFEVGGMQTRFGWRTFISVSANGQNYKLFGSMKSLGEQLQNAGYGHLSRQLEQGTQLNVPCRVVLSRNGRFTNVDQLLPLNGNNGRR